MNPYDDDNLDSEFDEIFYDDDSIEDLNEILNNEFVYCDILLANMIENQLEIFNYDYKNFHFIFATEKELEKFLMGNKAISCEELQILCTSLQIYYHNND